MKFICFHHLLFRLKNYYCIFCMKFFWRVTLPMAIYSIALWSNQAIACWSVKFKWTFYEYFLHTPWYHCLIAIQLVTNSLSWSSKTCKFIQFLHQIKLAILIPTSIYSYEVKESENEKKLVQFTLLLNIIIIITIHSCTNTQLDANHFIIIWMLISERENE